MPGEGGPWEFHNECKDYTVSRNFLKALKTEEKKLNTDKFNIWVDEIKATKDENCTENENIEFKYDYKVEMCYCKNEKDGNGNDLGTPCNGKKENGYWKTIGVSKSGVATLALTIVLLLISIIGTYERVLKGYFNNLNSSTAINTNALQSGLDVGQEINVVPGKFGKKKKPRA